MTTQASVLRTMTGSGSHSASQSLPRQHATKSAVEDEVLRSLFFLSVSLLVSLQFTGLLSAVPKTAVMWALAVTLGLGILLAPSCLKSWEFRWGAFGLVLLSIIVLATKGLFIVPLSILLIPTPNLTMEFVKDFGAILYVTGGLSVVAASTSYGIKGIASLPSTTHSKPSKPIDVGHTVAKRVPTVIDTRADDVYHDAPTKPDSKRIVATPFEVSARQSLGFPESEEEMHNPGTIRDIQRQSKGFILVADDEDSIRDGLRQALEEAGYSTATSSTGVEALVLAAQQDFDLAILDVSMAGLSGVQVLELLKRMSDLAVILISGQATVQTAIEGMKLGAFDYFTKPFDLDALLKKVEEAIGQRKDAAEAKSQRQDLDDLIKEQQARLRLQFAETVQSLAREFSNADPENQRSGDAVRDFVAAIRRVTQRGLTAQ